MSDDLLAEIFALYKPQEPAGPAEYRVYYTDEGIFCYSQEKMEYPYVVVDENTYREGRPDLYRIVDGKLVRKEIYFQNRNQLHKGKTYATIKDDMQFAVPADWVGEKDFWDKNG